ncbi:MAG: MFS transporter [Rhodocyclaceae bacterium]|nr:MFS transporter [Rhodocyclaceae bacterium]
MFPAKLHLSKMPLYSVPVSLKVPIKRTDTALESRRWRRDKWISPDAAPVEVTASSGRLGFVLLAAANFSVALGYGIVLPFIPLIVEHVSGSKPQAEHAPHIGAILGIYPFFLFLAAPLWGRIADRIGGRRILLTGLATYALALAAFAFADTLSSAYFLRATAGIAAGAVLPVVAAAVGSEINLRLRAKLFAGLSMATLFGLLAGPALSGSTYAVMQSYGGANTWTLATVAPPFIGVAAFVLLLLAGIWRWLPSPVLRVRMKGKQGHVIWRTAMPFLSASFFALLGLGAFEAVLPLAGNAQFQINTEVLSLLFAGCMFVMLAVELALFFTSTLHRYATNRSVALGFLGMAVGVTLLSASSSIWDTAAAVGMIAASSAFLQPAIMYMATLNANGGTGALLGALTGGGSLGQAAGSFFGGTLFGLIGFRSLWLVAVLLLLAAIYVRVASFESRKLCGTAYGLDEDG